MTTEMTMPKRIKRTNFHRKVATINDVAKKQVSCVLRMTPNVKKLHQVIVLTVNITTNYIMRNFYCPVSKLHIPLQTCGWCWNLKQIGLRSKNR